MARIATYLPSWGNIDRPVLDKTGLSGTYDFVIEFTPESEPSESPSAVTADGETFLEAMKEQLGLRLESQTGPVDVLVIDHIEEPSEN